MSSKLSAFCFRFYIFSSRLTLNNLDPDNHQLIVSTTTYPDELATFLSEWMKSPLGAGAVRLIDTPRSPSKQVKPRVQDATQKSSSQVPVKHVKEPLHVVTTPSLDVEGKKEVGNVTKVPDVSEKVSDAGVHSNQPEAASASVQSVKREVVQHAKPEVAIEEPAKPETFEDTTAKIETVCSSVDGVVDGSRSEVSFII